MTTTYSAKEFNYDTELYVNYYNYHIRTQRF